MAEPKPSISVVVVAYDMAPQLKRTVLSLSPRLQRGVAAEDYELIVVDNGSSSPIQVADLEDSGVDVRCLRIDDAPPSPARAVNLGLESARAPLVGVMIDGARMASPGLVKYSLLAAALAPRALIATLGFHLGAEPQHVAIERGYDAEAEQRLLDQVSWTEDPYRLFEISVFAVSSDRGWFGTPAESNALFMRAELWEDLGGYDEQFTSPGGGLVNHDAFRRACQLPGIEPVLLLGEGTFHQVHGGIATSGTHAQRQEFQEEYKRLRGRRYKRPDFKPLYLGRLSPSALTTMPEMAVDRPMSQLRDDR